MILQCFSRLSSASLLYSLLITVGAHPVVAADGDLDTTFDGDGKLITVIGGDQDIAQSVAIQSDGKIVAAGYSFIVRKYDFALVRFNADGTIDNDFGTGGKVTTAIGSYTDRAWSVAINQSNGKIVVAGSSYNSLDSNDDFALVRYNADGTLDNSFGTDGKVTMDVGGSNDSAYSVAIQSDGKIVAAGFSKNGNNDHDFALVRYETDGTPDTSFGTDGRVTTAIYSGDDYARSVVIQSDGKIVAAGFSYNGNVAEFALVRYTTNGNLDTDFGSGGKVTTEVGSSGVARAVALQSDGRIVAAGSSNDDFALVRYNADGTLDNSFGTGGKVTTDVGSASDIAYSVAIQSDAKIVVAGDSNNGSNADFALVRYNTNGNLDTDFGSGGKVTTEVGSGNDYAKSVAIQSDGKIVAAGYRRGSEDAFALARYAGTPPAPPISPGVLWFITRGTQVDEEE